MTFVSEAAASGLYSAPLKRLKKGARIPGRDYSPLGRTDAEPTPEDLPDGIGAGKGQSIREAYKARLDRRFVVPTSPGLKSRAAPYCREFCYQFDRGSNRIATSLPISFVVSTEARRVSVTGGRSSPGCCQVWQPPEKKPSSCNCLRTTSASST